jgi:hydrogenase 3 maturation protease
VDDLLGHLRTALSARRAVVMGVGNPLRGDDGFGPAVLRRLEGRIGCPLLDCGSAPENFAGKVRGMSPDVVLVVDAAELGAEPGELRLVEGARAGASGFSTHAAGLDMLFAYLGEQCGASGWLLAAQPAVLGLGEEMSAEMLGAVERAAGLLVEVLGVDA